MTYKIDFTSRARHQHKNLDRRYLSKIGKEIDTLKKDPHRRGVEPYRDIDNCYKFRVGGYRVIFELNKSKRLIKVLEIGRRGQIYKNMRRRKA